MARAASTSQAASSTLTVRLPVATKRRMERLAKTSRRSKSFLTLEAIENYLDLHEWQAQAIEDGLKDLDDGRTVPHEQVKAWLMTWGKGKETPPPWK
jgi:predicted transcriptional regulator